MPFSPPSSLLALAVTAALAALLGIAPLGCTTPNPDYCDEVAACADGRTCDLTHRRCVAAAQPGCIGDVDCSDPAAPLCVDGACAQCRASTDCPAQAPRCDASDHACTGCLGADDCTAHGDSAVCAPEGACVGCASEADCAIGDACDPIEATCRPCAADHDCEGGICLSGGPGCLSSAQIVHVSPDGVDRPGCSLAEPCATLTFALTHLAAGRPYLHMAAGGYEDNLELTDLQASIVAEPGAELRAALGDRPALRITGGEVSIEGLTVVGADSDAADAIAVDGGVLDLRDVVVQGAGGRGLAVTSGELRMTGGGAQESVSHGILVRGGRAELDGAELRDNRGAGVMALGGELVLRATSIAGNQDAGLVARDADVDMVNCFVHRNTSAVYAPVHFASSSVSGTARVVHTTVVDNLSGAAGSGGIVCAGAYEVTLRNDIIHGNQGPAAPVSGCDITYSLLGPEIAAGVGNVLGTPRFVDREGGDLHLVPDSVGVDDGTSGDADVDVDGDPRPIGSGPDMGADEVTRGTAILTQYRYARRRR